VQSPKDQSTEDQINKSSQPDQPKEKETGGPDDEEQSTFLTWSLHLAQTRHAVGIDGGSRVKSMMEAKRSHWLGL
jgi:hypothetical protein